MITNTKIIIGEIQRGGAQYMMMKIYIYVLVGNDVLGKPFWERKLIGENTPIDTCRGRISWEVSNA